MAVTDATAECTAVLDEVQSAVITDRRFLRQVLTGMVARGHVLLEDVPGVGKTLTARSIATALGLEFSRVQFTPDLLPADVIGTNVYDERDGTFEFSEGPIFANVVLADEINRAPPKTQAALLEAMEEGQVTVDGETHSLPEPFFVLATQNPVEQEGTFSLPEAQLDRFMIKSSMGYPDRDGELDLLDRRADRTAQAPSVSSVLDHQRVTALQEIPETVTVEPKVREYVVDLGRATREDKRVRVGVSPRGIQRLFEAARAYALIEGRDYVVPDDVKGIAPAVFSHRLVLTAESSVRSVSKRSVLGDVLDRVPAPSVDDD
ncbi:AAA family ATPase [Halorientalis brevis]|uniref:AAA family ATPase n=1 Tax=Halorientalis brevis TaxID=1126241 RepID=A0ABD6CDE4_9EURY|nr:AAA family ATPase [Halorientalis brevis]